VKVRTEVAITGNEPPRADVAIDGRGGIVWTITAHGRRVVLELSADEAVRGGAPEGEDDGAGALADLVARAHGDAAVGGDGAQDVGLPVPWLDAEGVAGEGDRVGDPRGALCLVPPLARTAARGSPLARRSSCPSVMSLRLADDC
jgi:hypothetical protein